MNIKTLDREKLNYKSGKLPAIMYLSELRRKKTGEKLYYAKVASRISLTMDNIADDIVCTNILPDKSKEEILRTWEAINAAITDRILNGATVKCGLGSFYAKIKGEFDSLNPRLNKKKEYIDIGFTSNGNIAKLAYDEKILPSFGSSGKMEPVITKIEDYHSKVDGIITPGKLISLKGHNIKLYEESDSEGIEFINIENPNSSVFVNLKNFIVNKNNHVICLIPQLSKGKYKIKLSTRYSKGRALKNSRSFTTKQNYTVI